VALPAALFEDSTNRVAYQSRRVSRGCQRATPVSHPHHPAGIQRVRKPVLIMIASLVVVIVLTTALLIATATNGDDHSTLSSITTYER
jgi:hypothetical protein